MSSTPRRRVQPRRRPSGTSSAILPPRPITGEVSHYGFGEVRYSDHTVPARTRQPLVPPVAVGDTFIHHSIRDPRWQPDHPGPDRMDAVTDPDETTRAPFARMMVVAVTRKLVTYAYLSADGIHAGSRVGSRGHDLFLYEYGDQLIRNTHPTAA